MVKSVLVAGEGLAGLVAALACKKGGVENVQVASLGKGAISIAPGSLDILGYVSGKVIKGNPLDHLSALPKNHPYRAIGRDKILESIKFFISSIEGLIPLYYSAKSENIPALTTLGTVKPTFIMPSSFNIHNLDNAKKIAIIDIDNLRDFNATFLQSALSKLSFFSNKQLLIEKLSIKSCESAYELNSLDIARRVKKDEILEALKGLSNNYDGFILPTILGVYDYSEIYSAIENEGIRCVELLNMAPAIGGLRVRNALMKACSDAGISFVENCELEGAEFSGKSCNALISKAGDRLCADCFIIATGSYLSGGLALGFNNILLESIFKQEVVKLDKDVAQRDLFSKEHKFAYLGIDINNKSFDNVFFAGSILAGYDYATEKSGSGVAIASGYIAAERAIKL